MSKAGCHPRPHPTDHSLLFASSHQPHPTLPPQWRLTGRSSRKQLDSKALLRSNYNVLFHSNINLKTNSKQNTCAPELPGYCRVWFCSPQGGNPPAKLSPSAVSGHTHDAELDALPRVGKAWTNAVSNEKSSFLWNLPTPSSAPTQLHENISAQCLEVAIKS